MTSDPVPPATRPRDDGRWGPPETPPVPPDERRRPLRAVALLLLGLVAPWTLGLDALPWGDADPQTAWARTIDGRLRDGLVATPGRKVLFVGGSSVYFGLNPPSLAARIGRPVAAYGLHAGLGMDVVAESAVELIGSGDVVVYAPELPGFERDYAISPALRGDWLRGRTTVADHPEARLPLRAFHAARARARRARAEAEARLPAAWARSQRRARGEPEPPVPASPYESAAVSASGHLVFPRPAASAAPVDNPPSVDAADYDLEGSTAARGARLLADACRRVGARLVTMPGMRVQLPGAPPGYRERVAGFEELWMRSVEALGATRLLAPGTTTLEPEFAYDTAYHLNDRGVAEMEERLAEALARVLRPPR